MTTLQWVVEETNVGGQRGKARVRATGDGERQRGTEREKRNALRIIIENGTSREKLSCLKRQKMTY